MLNITYKSVHGVVLEDSTASLWAFPVILLAAY